MPSPNEVIIRPDLSGPFNELDLALDRQNFIGGSVLKPVPVNVNHGKFSLTPIEELLQDHDTKRAPGGGYNRGDLQFDMVEFSTVEHGFESPVDDREAKIYADFFDAEQAATQRAVDFVAREFEREAASLLFNPTTFAGMTGGVTNEWDDYESATPIADVEAAIQAIWDACGLWPNALVINGKVFRNLRNCDEIVDRITSNGAGTQATAGKITRQQLAECFGLDHIFVGGSPRNDANQGQDVSISSIWSDEFAMVCRVAETNDIKEPCLARAFQWIDDSSYNGSAKEVGVIIEQYRCDERRAEIYRARTDWDQRIILPEAGYLLSNITTIGE